MKRKRVMYVAMFLGAFFSSYGQEGVNLNQYYQYPLGVGVEYRSLSSLSSLALPYNIMDISGFVMVPVAPMPAFQPFLRAGLTRFDSLDSADPLKWDHDQFYGLAGTAWAPRFSRNFEAGLDLGAGFSEAVFRNAVPGAAYGNPFFLAEGGARLGLDPSYGFSMVIAPRLRYQVSLGPLSDLDGLFASVGVSAAFRFGDDPDTSKALIRSLKFADLRLQSVFPAMKGYYDANPLGYVTLVNTESQPVTDVEVQFFQKGFMDSPTASAKLERLPPRGSAEVPLRAIFNRQVFSVEGSQALTGEIIVQYRRGGKPAEQRESVSYRLEDRRAINWDDDRKVAAFITPQDSALKNYSAYLARLFQAGEMPNYDKPFQFAMQAYSGLREMDLLYQEDPSTPYTKARGAEILDTVNLARETLKRRYGDCDDLTVLFASILETRNVESGFVTVPGHILPAFNTKIPADQYRILHPDRSMTIPVEGELWIPVEATLLDRDSGFLDAWAKGIEEWKAGEGKRVLYRTKDAQAVFAPVALDERDLGLQYGSAKAVVGYLDKDMARHADTVVKAARAQAEKSGAKKDFLLAGVMAAMLDRLADAEDSFSRAMKLDAKYLSAIVNLGNVYYLRKQFDKAVVTYESARRSLSPDTAASSGFAVYVNLAKAYVAAGKGTQAREAMVNAERIDPEKAVALGSAILAAVPGRAAAAADDRALVFPMED